MKKHCYRNFNLKFISFYVNCTIMDEIFISMLKFHRQQAEKKSWFLSSLLNTNPKKKNEILIILIKYKTGKYFNFLMFLLKRRTQKSFLFLYSHKNSLIIVFSRQKKFLNCFTIGKDAKCLFDNN